MKEYNANLKEQLNFDLKQTEQLLESQLKTSSEQRDININILSDTTNQKRSHLKRQHENKNLIIETKREIDTHQSMRSEKAVIFE